MIGHLDLSYHWVSTQPTPSIIFKSLVGQSESTRGAWYVCKTLLLWTDNELHPKMEEEKDQTVFSTWVRKPKVAMITMLSVKLPSQQPLQRDGVEPYWPRRPLKISRRDSIVLLWLFATPTFCAWKSEMLLRSSSHVTVVLVKVPREAWQDRIMWIWVPTTLVDYCTFLPQSSP